MSSLLGGHRPYAHLDHEDDFPSRSKRDAKKRAKLLKCVAWAVAALSALLLGAVACAVALWRCRGSSVAPPVAPAAASSAAFEDALVVRTNCGEFVGTIEEGAFAFKGIPYARAPVGHLRWKRPVACWAGGGGGEAEGRRRAHRPAHPCFHLHPQTGLPVGTEDCLRLDVWSPRLDTSAGLPVLVWLGGGALWWPGPDGLAPSGRLAAALGAVVVSARHRLGPLGFLNLEILQERPGRDARGNYGLWDALTALRWVRHNVKAFGGDPDKVTAWGSGAGASCARALGASPLARGLFRSLWLAGPSATLNVSFEAASRRDATAFQARSGCDEASCLRRMTPREVFSAWLGRDALELRERDRNDLPVMGIRPQQMIVIDGELLTSAIEENSYDDIPSLVGSAAQATDWWPGPDDVGAWDWAHLSKYVATSLDSFGPGVSREALRLYNATEPGEDGWSAEEAYSGMVSDLRQICPVHSMSRESSAPVYRYVVTATPSAPVKLLGHGSALAFHGWDVIAFLDHLDLFLKPPAPADYRFRDALRRTVAAFIRNGALPTQWRPFPDAVALFGTNGTVDFVDEYHEKQCRFWHENGFDDYAWVS